MQLNISTRHQWVRFSLRGVFKMRPRLVLFLLQILSVFIIFFCYEPIQVLVEKVVELLPDFALLVQIFDLHLRFNLKVLHKQFAIISTDTLYFLSDLVCKKINPFFTLLQFYRLLCKHERERHTPV